MTQGKGSTRRPRAITPEEEAEAWERTFGDKAKALQQANLRHAEETVLRQPPAPWMERNPNVACWRIGCGVPCSGVDCVHCRATPTPEAPE